MNKLSAHEIRSIILRIVALALLLLLSLVAVLTIRSLNRLPNTLVYFILTEQTRFSLKASSRHLSSNSREDHLFESLNALIAGPTSREKAEGLSTDFPPETTIHSLKITDDHVEVNLSRAFIENSDKANLIGRLNQLFYTLTQPTYTNEVTLLIDGESMSRVGNIVDQPWKRDEHQAFPSW